MDQPTQIRIKAKIPDDPNSNVIFVYVPSAKEPIEVINNRYGSRHMQCLFITREEAIQLYNFLKISLGI